jgi:hypothetical protein
MFDKPTLPVEMIFVMINNLFDITDENPSELLTPITLIRSHDHGDCV